MTIEKIARWSVAVRWNPARLKRLLSHFNSLVLRSFLLQEARGARTCERNNVVKREDCGRQEAGKFALKLIWLPPASCRDAVFTWLPSWIRADPKGIKSPSERETRLRIRMSANQSFDYNIEIRRRGEEEAWFHLPVANRNRNPVQTATIDIYYVDRGELNWLRTRPLRALKSKRPNATNPSCPVHSGIARSAFSIANIVR